MEGLINDLREFELKVANKLSEVEQLELHNLISCVRDKFENTRDVFDSLTDPTFERI